MKYRFSKSELTCTSLETEMGLARGDIRQINVIADGTVEADVAKDLNSTQQTKLRSLLELAEKVVL
jgi:hypothetical protein